MTHARIRLPHAAYQSGHAVSIVICTRLRRPVFKDTDLALACVDVLRAMSGRTGVAVPAYCLMPEHVHLLLVPSAQMGLVDFVARWKGSATRLGWRHGLAGRWWQARFYDHVLRNDESVRACAQYILNNPVRAGMVMAWNDYPLCGSFEFTDL